MAIVHINDLAKELKTGRHTLSDIKAMDLTSYIRKFPSISIQQLRCAGYPIDIITNASGDAAYHIVA